MDPIDQHNPPATPAYLQRWPGLFMHRDGKVVEAPAADVAVAKSYPASLAKGPLHKGRRITLLCAPGPYAVGDEVRVIHVYEVTDPGENLFVMGPKPVSGEVVDGVAITPPATALDTAYDGRVLPSPGVDYNYDITSHRFSTPGRHTIQWQLGDLRSNLLEVDVAPAAGTAGPG